MNEKHRSSMQKARPLRRYLGESEDVILETRQHPFAVIKHFAIALGWIIPIVVISWLLMRGDNLPGSVTSLVLKGLLIFGIFIIARLIWRVLCWEFEKVIVTSQKVILVSGVLSRRIASTPLSKVSEFTVKQPFLGRIFGYGSLVVDVPGGRDQTLHGLAFVPDPAGMYRIVSDLASHTQQTSRKLLQPEAVKVSEEFEGRYVYLDEESKKSSKSSVLEKEIPINKSRVMDGYNPDHTIEIPREYFSEN